MNSRIVRWIRILANLFGAFGALIAFVNPPAIFNGEQPAGFFFLGASAALWMLTIRAPLTGPARILELGGAAAIVILIAFYLTKVPAIHDRLLVREHEGKGPKLHWAQESDDLDPRYGPRLVRSDEAMAQRYSLLREYPTAHNIVRDSFDYFFVYASFRLRGKSDEQIFADPIGPALFLGTLIAESYPSPWWETADWFKDGLNAHPSVGWKLGLLPAEWARSKFQTLAANPPAGDSQVLEALLVVEQARPDFGTPAQFQSQLETWSGIQKAAGHPLDASLEARQGIARALQNCARVRFEYPDTWSSKARDIYTRQLMMFLHASGVNPEVGADGVPIKISAAFLAWNDVEYTLQEQVWKEVEVQHAGGPILGTKAFRSPYTSHTDVSQVVHTDGRGRIGVPTLVVKIGDASFALPPVTIINRNSADHLSECDPGRDKNKDIYEEFLAGMTLAPWQFALSSPAQWPR